MADRNASTVQATRTSASILEAVQQLDGAGVSELARHLDRSKSGVYKHVQTLTDLGYLVREGTTYHLGLQVWTLGATVRDRLPVAVVRPTIDDLAASTNHTVGFAVYENGTAAYVYRATDVEPEHTEIGAGDRIPLHATATGKAILAYLADDQRSDVLREEPLTAYTDATITDRNALAAELQSVREQRIAYDDGEFDPSIQCLSSPILGADGQPQGAITVASTADQETLRMEQKVTGLLVSASKSIENTLSDD